MANFGKIKAISFCYIPRKLDAVWDHGHVGGDDFRDFNLDFDLGIFRNHPNHTRIIMKSNTQDFSYLKLVFITSFTDLKTLRVKCSRFLSKFSGHFHRKIFWDFWKLRIFEPEILKKISEIFEILVLMMNVDLMSRFE